MNIVPTCSSNSVLNMASVIEPEKSSNSNPSPLNFTSKSSPCSSLYSPKLWFFILANFVVVLVLFRSQSTEISSPWISISQWQEMFTNSRFQECASKLREAVTFLPLKDLRYTNEPMKGRTWFMSSFNDIHDEVDQLQYQQFPTQASRGRVLCLRGNNTNDGSWNSYALAWLDALPQNATLVNGTTFVSYNHYDYDNIWHGLSAMMPFVAWHIKKQCAIPNRFILYHWGELRRSMAPWLQTLLESTFSSPIYIENFDRAKVLENDQSSPLCFEEAVVMRHNEGGLTLNKRIETFDLMRCKARMYCNVSSKVRNENEVKIGMTLLLRDGARSFRNDSLVIEIFKRECRKVSGCQLIVAHSNNLTFCEQVELMSKTDIIVSPHGAQLTNLFLMDKYSSVMEFFPKGWLKLAGVGQFVFHWLADWSNMKHQGTWRDPDGDSCPYPEDDHRCFPIFKNGKIGHNETYFSEWARNVLDYQTSVMKSQSLHQKLVKNGTIVSNVKGLCGCS